MPTSSGSKSSYSSRLCRPRKKEQFHEGRGSKVDFEVALGGIGVGLRGGFGTNWHHAGCICGEESWRAGTGCCVPTSWEF
jgi:hypothetical protein